MTGPLYGRTKTVFAPKLIQAGVSEENLYISNITVNKGVVLKRSMPRARGSASRINKRTSHVMLTLVEKSPENKVKKTKKGMEAKETKKVIKKVPTTEVGKEK